MINGLGANALFEVINSEMLNEMRVDHFPKKAAQKNTLR